METMNASYIDTLLASCRKDSSSVMSNKPAKQLYRRAELMENAVHCVPNKESIELMG